nr:hypothetical protein A4A59_33250 [Rhizobium leguminosarum]
MMCQKSAPHISVETILGLREDKKDRTRAQLLEAALDLIHKRGFEETTVADIAASRHANASAGRYDVHTSNRSRSSPAQPRA